MEFALRHIISLSDRMKCESAYSSNLAGMYSQLFERFLGEVRGERGERKYQGYGAR